MTPQTFGSVCHGQRVFPSWMYPSGTLGSIDAYSSGIKWRTFCAIDCLLQDAIQMCPTVWNIHNEIWYRGRISVAALRFFFLHFYFVLFLCFYLWVMNWSGSVMKWGRAVELLHLRGTFLHLVVCFRHWRAHLSPALLSPAAALMSTEVVLVAREDKGKWCGCADRIWKGNMSLQHAWTCAWCLCVYLYVSVKESVLSVCFMC